MRPTPRLAAVLAASALLLAPGRAAPPPPGGIFIAYPDPNATVAFDHVILEGSVAPGAALTVDGRRVTVGADGLFMEWWPLREGVNDLRFVSTRAGRTERATLRVTRRVERPLPATPSAIRPGTAAPTGALAYWDAANDTPAERTVALSVQGSVGGRATYRLAGSPPVAMREGPAGTYTATYTLPTGAAFQNAAITYALTGRDGRTVTATAPGRLSSAGTGPRLAVQRAGTVRGRALNDATNLLTDLAGAPLLYPRDGMAFLAVGRQGDDLRVRLAPGVSALVTAEQVGLAPGAVTAGSGGEVTVDPDPSALRLRLPLGGARLPFTIEQIGDGTRLDLTLYGVLDALLLPPAPDADSLLAGVEVAEVAPGVTRVGVDLAPGQAWGFEANYDGDDLVLSVRRPPVLDALRPLAGRTITLDPGHGGTAKGGAGSLRVPEKGLVLPIARRAAELLRAQGAAVVLTRTADTTLGLYERGLAAEGSNSDLLVSIHANALPDGRDPRGVRGPEVYFTHPQAEAVSDAILRRLRSGLPDLGPGAGLKPGAFFALTRPSAQPSLLVETAYLTDAGNLRLLNSSAGQERLAQAIAAGIADFYQAQVAR